MIFPKITIVTPVFNQVDYIEETILSVLNQGYPNLEYIIIDGGSTDGTIDIIKKYAKDLHFWVSEPDSGMYEAIQKGFEHSTGDVMAWIGSDDMYHPRSFFSIGKIFSSLPNVEWLVGATTYFNSQGICVEVKQSRPFTQNHFLCGDYQWIQQESCFWRRSLWEKAGGSLNTSLRYAGDYDLWLRFFRHSSLYITNCLLGGFRMRGEGQLSHDHREEYLSEVDQLIKREPISNESLKIIQKYQRHQRWCRFVKKSLLPFKQTICDFIMKSAIPLPKHYRVAYDTEKESFYIV